MRLLLSISSLLLISAVAAAQPWIKIDSVFSPFGVTAQNFSAPEYCDLDGDGDLDLTVASLSADRIEYFVNKGTAAAPLFRKDTAMYASIYANGTQFTNSDYVAFVDIDKDNDHDLVIGGFNGLHLYWNGGDALEAVWFRDTVFFSAINAVIGSDPKPAFADLDADGDQDLIVGIGESLLGGPTPGICMAFRNTGTPAQAVYTADNTLITGIPDVGLNAFPVLKDWDNDGDVDMVMGRDLQSLIYYKNTGTPSAPVWTNTGGIVSVVEVTSYWKVPSLADLDGDGDLDLTYGTSDGTIYYYRNIGSATAPQLQSFTGYFQMIRTNGNAASVSFGDYDKDGDLDFISGDWLGGIQYFRNDGNASRPAFTKTTAAFTSLDAGSYSTPEFVDIDNDGDLDIVSGELLGTLILWVNNNGSFSANTSMFAGIDAGYRSAPAFTDLDKDGDLDMLLGAEESSMLRFYRNSGNNVYVKDSTYIIGVTSAYVAHPAFTDLDKDGDQDLLMGTGFGEFLYFENTGTASAPAWKRNDAPFAGIEVRQGAAPAFADLDQDGRIDLVSGEYNGNFTFFKNVSVTSVSTAQQHAPTTFALQQNYPNPFNPTTAIPFTIPATFGMSTNVRLSMFDLLGREVALLVNEQLAAGTYTVTWNAAEFPSGAYICRLNYGNRTESRRIMLLK